jgi:hypothetical protein
VAAVESKPRVALLAVVGVLLAVGIGVAAYAVSKDSVGLPVTKLDPKPLAPTVTRPNPAIHARTTTQATTSRATTSVDDHGGSDNSGRGRGGGHGGDD